VNVIEIDRHGAHSSVVTVGVAARNSRTASHNYTGERLQNIFGLAWRAASSDDDVATTIRQFAMGEAELIGRLHELFRNEMTRAAGPHGFRSSGLAPPAWRTHRTFLTCLTGIPGVVHFLVAWATPSQWPAPISDTSLWRAMSCSRRIAVDSNMPSDSSGKTPVLAETRRMRPPRGSLPMSGGHRPTGHGRVRWHAPTLRPGTVTSADCRPPAAFGRSNEAWFRSRVSEVT
jgi:hypothetical protein